jgi:O-antigen ligase
VPRPSGPFENPNIYGNYLVMIVFFALGARAMLDQQMVHPWSMVTRLIARYRTGALMGVAPVILFGLLSTGSRGAMLGLGVGALAYVPWTRLRVRPRRALLVGLAALLVLPAGVWYFQQHPFVMVRITRTLEGDGPNIDGRFILWRAARDAFLGNPFFGVGYGEFGPYAERTHDLPPMVTHETYLSQACELGIFGLLLFIVLFGSVLLDSWHLTRRGSGLARACFAYLVATAVQGLTNNVDQFRAVWIVFGILAAFMVNREEALPPAARGPS